MAVAWTAGSQSWALTAFSIAALCGMVGYTAGELMDKINATGDWNDDIEAAFKKGIEEFKATGTW